MPNSHSIVIVYIVFLPHPTVVRRPRGNPAGIVIRVFGNPGMSHVKAAVIDGWASVGTANFDKLSLQVNKEVNLATSHAPTINQLLARAFLPDLAASTEITQMVEVTLPDRLIEVIVDEVL